MNATRHYLFALLAVFGLAIVATAETRLINPIARSFRPPQPRVSPAAFQQGDSPAGVGEQPAPPPAADVPAATDAVTPAPATTVPPATAEPAAAAAADAAADAAAVQPAENPPAPVPIPAAEATEPDENAVGSSSDLEMPELLGHDDDPEVAGKDKEKEKDEDIKDSCGNPCCCDGGCCRAGGRRWSRLGGAEQPWTLPQPRALQHMGIKVGGWIQGGITTNNTNPTDNYNSYLALNDRDGEFQFNQMWAYISRPIKQEDSCWQVGGHADIVWGSDWRFGRFFGLEERINNDDQFYGWVFPQLYAEFGGHNLSVKIGHMAGPLGYEIVPAVANFFYSHSIAMDYFEPQLVTGVWADYKLNDNWTVQGGFHRGWFMFEDLDTNFDVMGGIQWTSCDKRTSVRYAITSGPNPGLYGDNWFASSLVLKHKFNEKWEYVLQHDLGTINNVNPAGLFGAGPIGDEEWYGINQYLFYTINKKLKAGMRVEWMRDDDGGKLLGVGNLINRGWPGGPGYAGNFWEVTAGLNWNPHPNVRFRPEVRWDWYDGPPNLLDGTFPLDDFAGKDQVTAAFDMLITF